MEKLSMEVKVGLVVTLALGLVLAFLVLLGEYNPFTNTYRITVTLNYAGGIKPGSDVHLAGAKVGKVDAIRFFTTGHDQDRPVLGLELLIDKRAKNLIRKDSSFSIHMESLLGGKIVQIEPGSPGSRVLHDGDATRGIDPPNLQDLMAEAVQILEGAKDLLDGLGPEDRERFKKLLESLTRFGPEDVENLRRIIHNTADATEDLKHIAAEIRPDLKPLMSDLRSTLAEAEPMLRSARSLVWRIDGAVDELRQILPEDTDAARARVEELLKTTDELTAMIGRLNRFTVRMEKELEGMSREELERIIRQFLQQEGVTINVGKIAGDPGYPPPPQKSGLNKTIP